MKYGLNPLLWTPEVTAEQAPILADVKRWGYDGAELPLFGGDESTGRELGKLCDDAGLARTAVTVCTAEENPISPDAGVRAAGRDHLKSIFECCAAAGVETLCGPIHSALGVFTGDGRTELEWNHGVETLRQVAEHAADIGVTLAVEGIYRFESYFLNTQTDAAELDRPALGCMCDTFHANIEEKDAAAAIRHVAGTGTLRHVHISENDRSTPGEGQVAWDATFAALKKAGYDGWMVIEAFGLAMSELAEPTKIWRRMYPSEEHLAVEGLKFMKSRTA